MYQMARAHLQCMLSLRSFHRGLDFPHMSLVQIVQSPRTQIKRKSPNETQMWNVSAQLDLRQLRLRGRLFPESHNINKTISITPLWPESAKRSRLLWKENTFSVFTLKNQLLLEAASKTTTTWKNKDLQSEFLKNAFLMKAKMLS